MIILMIVIGNDKQFDESLIRIQNTKPIGHIMICMYAK